MVSHDKPIPSKNNGERQKKKSDVSEADPSDDGFSYSIDRLNLGVPANDSESESK